MCSLLLLVQFVFYYPVPFFIWILIFVLQIWNLFRWLLNITFTLWYFPNHTLLIDEHLLFLHHALLTWQYPMILWTSKLFLRPAICLAGWSFFGWLCTLPVTFYIFLKIHLFLPLNIYPCHLTYFSETLTFSAICHIILPLAMLRRTPMVSSDVIFCINWHFLV